MEAGDFSEFGKQDVRGCPIEKCFDRSQDAICRHWRAALHDAILFGLALAGWVALAFIYWR
jgi:hypothetical protein